MNKIKELIRRRRRQIIVHSFGYYRLNETLVTDHVFDSWCKELVELQTSFPKLSREVEYYHNFKDFDGSTGFDLPTGDPWVAVIWNRISSYMEVKKEKNLFVLDPGQEPIEWGLDT